MARNHRGSCTGCCEKTSLEKSSPNVTAKLCHVVKKNSFFIMILGSMVIGITLGAGLRHVNPPLDENAIMYLRFPGEMFLRMLRMMLIPLVVCSLIAATTSVTPNSSGRMGLISLVYYIGSTALAVVTGISLALLIKPGDSGQQNLIMQMDTNNTSSELRPTITDALLDLVRNLIPRNMVGAMFQKDTTVIVADGISNKTGEMTYKKTLRPYPGTNVLGLITFCLVFGVVVSRLGKTGRPLVKFFEAANAAIMKMVTIMISSAPVGIVSLIAAKIVEVEDPISVLSQLSWFVLAYLLSLGIHALVTLPAIFFIITRRNPYLFILNIGEALVTMFSVASSAAILPVTIRCLVEKNKVDKRAVEFTAPIGATINMDGSALYLAMAAIFLAQYNGMELSTGDVITVGLTAIAGSIGVASIPSASLVVIMMVLTSVGIPTDIGLLATVDWLLDRFRGLVNIVSDGFAAGIVDKLGIRENSKGRADYQATPTSDGNDLVETV